jgi:hypothetical protein
MMSVYLVTDQHFYPEIVQNRYFSLFDCSRVVQNSVSGISLDW